MPEVHSRRRFLAGLSGISAAALLPAPCLATEGSLETTSVRLPNFFDAGICTAPQYVMRDLLAAEGITNIAYVESDAGLEQARAVAKGDIDLCLQFSGPLLVAIDQGAPCCGRRICASASRPLLRSVL